MARTTLYGIFDEKDRSICFKLCRNAIEAEEYIKNNEKRLKMKMRYKVIYI